ncbi:peptidase inhibitor family I36 protein [Streptomyces sp. NPDC086023]|uniref:peptidase inhibitor family I36 protein n=1 Tax=Streptomyces sp. NPDC086023 TaxID=3365746 RepID=UPI0037D5010F
MNRTLRRLASASVTAAALCAAALSTAAPASAYAKDGYLEVEEFGLYYSTGGTGCVFDLSGSDNNFTDNKFRGPSGCYGYGTTANDNTESYRNRDVVTWQVWTDVYYDGSLGYIPKGYGGDASLTFKNKISSSNYSFS